MQFKSYITTFAKKVCLVLFVLAVCNAAADTATDEIRLLNRESRHGEFVGYNNNELLLRDSEGQELRLGTGRVREMLLDPPRAMDIVRDSETSRRTIHGYRTPFLYVGRNGRQERIPLRGIDEIRLPGANPWQEPEPLSTVISRGELFELDDVLESGRPTVLHFHFTGDDYSRKIETYLSRLVAMSNGRINYLQAVTERRNAPFIGHFDIELLPTIWIFDQRGRAVSRLAGNMTTREIDDALQRAGNGPPAR